MTAFSVHSVCTLNTPDRKKGTYAQSLMTFASFIILRGGVKRTITVVQYLLNHSILLILRKSGLGRKGVCSPHYPTYSQGYSEHTGNFFPFHSYSPCRTEDCTLQLSEHSISTRSQILCTSRITTLLQHFIMPVTRIHKQL